MKQWRKDLPFFTVKLGGQLYEQISAHGQSSFIAIDRIRFTGHILKDITKRKYLPSWMSIQAENKTLTLSYQAIYSKEGPGQMHLDCSCLIFQKSARFVVGNLTFLLEISVDCYFDV